MEEHYVYMHREVIGGMDDRYHWDAAMEMETQSIYHGVGA